MEFDSNQAKELGKKVLTDIVMKDVAAPITAIVDSNIQTVVNSIGLFVSRSIQGKFERSITLTVNHNNAWMEEALYQILNKYNNIKKSPNLELVQSSESNGSMYSRLAVGSHNLKYRNYDIMLCLQKKSSSTVKSIPDVTMVYTIVTHSTNSKFIDDFERDMVECRNNILKIKSDSNIVNIFTDVYEYGDFFWLRSAPIYKRKLSTIYLPIEQKKLLVDTINRFISSKKYYIEHGIPHNLKILLFGPPGTGKTSLVKVIASEWNRNIYECTGGRSGKNIPQALTMYGCDIISPLYSISDIDKFPMLINERPVNYTSNKSQTDEFTEEKISFKQDFGRMINALDGMLSGEDKIIIMTTNHIEKFSPAFLRSGRIDLKMELGYVTPEVFRKYVYDFYNRILDKDIKVKDKVTVADMQFDVMYLRLGIDDFLDKYLEK